MDAGAVTWDSGGTDTSKGEVGNSAPNTDNLYSIRFQSVEWVCMKQLCFLHATFTFNQKVIIRKTV